MDQVLIQVTGKPQAKAGKLIKFFAPAFDTALVDKFAKAITVKQKITGVLELDLGGGDSIDIALDIEPAP